MLIPCLKRWRNFNSLTPLSSFNNNISHLKVIIQDLGKSIVEYNAKLVIVDSIIALHRAEFTGRGTLAERQQRLNIMLHKLSRLAEVHNIAVVVTNQVQSQPHDFSAGRNVMAHATTYTILAVFIVDS
ncbi:MAG: hypothetical protein WA323_07055 [Candidatus Nitrosopolaris sp.]